MKRGLWFLSIIGVALVISGCGGSTGDDGITDPLLPKAKALDPYITVRIRNQLDTTTAAGRAHWRIYALLSGPYTNQNGIAFQGAISLSDVRNGHVMTCGGAGADSVGQRLYSQLAIADTTEAPLNHDTTSTRISAEWFAGDQTLPSGWMAIVFPPTDLWDSEQFAAGHGLVPSDPIKWGWDWQGAGTATLYERAAADTVGCNVF